MADYPRVTHPCATPTSEYCYPEMSVRLACLIHAASVRSEPESNSPLKTVIPRLRDQSLRRTPLRGRQNLTFLNLNFNRSQPRISSGPNFQRSSGFVRSLIFFPKKIDR